jgi:hypothetical protein
MTMNHIMGQVDAEKHRVGSSLAMVDATFNRHWVQLGWVCMP